VGFGAGGTVYRGHDAELDRVVALKMLHESASDSTNARERLAREAKVMAKVVHPNVVAVYDVGIAGERLFLATEFVDGGTLDAWCRAAPRSWREIVEIFVEAGHGLAAIHSSGLVHRDFKPHNVMVGRDGRVRVTDFGLARLLPELEAHDRERVEESSPRSRPSDETLTSQTRPGTLVGTPAYMAPEQLRGERADARSDQFAYCIALYEALWGERPFAGKTLAALVHNVCNEPPRAPPSKPKLPRWLVQTILRGLSHEPADRFEDMQALLYALTESPRRSRRNRVTVALTAGFVLMAGTGYAAASLGPDTCALDQHRISEVWNDETREAVLAALEQTPEVGQSVVAELDRWVASWKDMSRQVCEASDTDLRGERQIDLQRACLDRRASELRAVTAVLRERDDALSEHVLDVIATVGAPARCADVETLETIEPTWGSPLGRVLSREIAADLDRVDALRQAGRVETAHALAEHAVAHVEDSGDHAVRAEALVALGLVQVVARDLEAAESTLHRGIWAAEASGHVVMAARGWLSIARLMVGIHADPARARQAALRASAAVHRANDRALELELAVLRVGVAYIDGELDEALEHIADLMDRARAVYGDDDPQTARLMHNMAAILHALERFDEAAELAARCVSIFESRFDGRHPDLPEMLNGLGLIEMDRGNLRASRPHLERGLAVARELFPEDHGSVVRLIAGLALLDAKEKRYREAAIGLEKVLAIHRAGGDIQVDTPTLLHNLAFATSNLGDHERAIELYRDILENEDPDAPAAGDALHGMGRSLAALGRADEAIEPLQRALELRAGGPRRRAALTHFELGRALHECGDPVRARSHVEQALATLRDAPNQHELRDELQAWLTRTN
jgi:eukaryotic-like serine/threonine-protein kinase